MITQEEAEKRVKKILNTTQKMKKHVENAEAIADGIEKDIEELKEIIALKRAEEKKYSE